MASTRCRPPNRQPNCALPVLCPLSDCTELLAAAQEQLNQLAEYLQQLPDALDGADEEAVSQAAAQRAQLEGVLQERQAAAALVEEVLELAQSVSRRLSGV